MVRRKKAEYITLYGKIIEYCWKGKECKYYRGDMEWCALWGKEFGYSCMQCDRINYLLKHLFKKLPYGWGFLSGGWIRYIQYKVFGIDIWKRGS